MHEKLASSKKPIYWPCADRLCCYHSQSAKTMSGNDDVITGQPFAKVNAATELMRFLYVENIVIRIAVDECR